MGNTTIIAGHNLGLGDRSARLLNRNDPLGNGSLDKNQSAYINVANGNLVIQEQDAMLTSQGDDFSLVRTYNSRGKLGGADRRATGERHRRQAKTESAFCRRCANLLAQHDGGAGIAGGKKRELVEIGG